MTIWRLLRVGLTVPLLLGGLVLVTAGPAAACSCGIVPSEAERVARADAVFVGTLVSQVTQMDYKARELMASPDPADRIRALGNDTSRTVWTFKVSRVYKGAVGKRQEIVTPPGGPPNCGGLGVSGTEPFLVFAYKWAGDRFRLEPGQYASGICGGSRRLAAGGAPVLGPWAGGPGWPDSLVGVGALAAGVAAGLGLASLRARHRASAD